jgi:glycosyltransferase involved in cell wall biosynthesis
VLIAISPEIRDDLLALGIGKPSQYEVVRLGFDLTRHLSATASDAALRVASGIPLDVTLVGIVGRLVPIKDHATMFEAIRSLPGVHLAVLGDGELRGQLETLVRSMGIDDRVHFVGWWLDMPTALVDLDVVALSSRNEGTPVALIEALACGRPVVSTDVGGVRSVVQDGETGRLVPPGDPAALAATIAEVLRRPDRGLALAETGRTLVATRFGQDRLVDEISAIYDDLLRGARR